jgi:primosomal protein N' (replication factor Y) (superfamily II helicase)
MFALVLVALPLPPLTYRVPENLALKVGDAVKVGVRRKQHDGIVLELLAELPEGTKFSVRDLDGISPDYPALNEDSLRLIKWTADYYHYPAGEVLRTILPPDPAPPRRARFRLTPLARERLKANERPRGKVQQAIIDRAASGEALVIPSAERASALKLAQTGWLEEFEVDDDHLSAPANIVSSSPLSLTDKQAEAVGSLTANLDARQFETFLLQGVTGSGKTEVYLRTAQHALRLNRSVLVVVPEIALTPQLLSRFRSRLGVPIALLHSGMSDGERSKQWHQLNRGLYRVCVGARSAVLAPLRDLGLIVVDEEHDSALKQEDHLKYNARDLAIVRAKLCQATVVLGSATPSLETFHNASVGRYRHLQLPERPGGQPMPTVVIVDRSKGDREGSIGGYLRKQINEALSRKEQVMLLLNRRGFSSFLLCEGCGFVPECPNCSVSLTNYKSSRRLKCHYCGYNSAVPPSCPKCAAPELVPGTLGTESLEEEVRELFPDARVIRIDRESISRKGSLEEALGAIARQEVDIVIGTQIIAKGHDFPNISLVGVVNADSSIHLPDFRAGERSFQLFTQMAGRAGRADIAGRVVVQTYDAKHPSIVHAANHDYRRFAEEELRFRHDFHYPPFTRMARLLVTAATPEDAERGAEKLTETLKRVKVGQAVEIVGPAPAVLSKVQNKFRWNLLLKCPQATPLHTLLQTAVASAENLLPRGATLQVDVDPVSLM